MVNKKRCKRIAMVLACILIPVGAFGFGYFFRTDEKEKQVENTLTVDGSIEGSIAETSAVDMKGIVPGDTLNETININPKSTADSLIRVKIEPSWEGGDNAKNLATENIKFIYADGVSLANNVEQSNAGDWFKAADGYLYYMSSVTSRTEAMPLVKELRFNAGTSDQDANKYQGKQLKIKVTMDMVQCKYNAFETKWNISKDTSLGKKLDNICNPNK